MELLKTLFGQGTHLSIMQMVCRGIVVFVISLVILRIAGKRTFGKRSAIDNVIIIVLGAILSRAITGASPFLPSICCSLAMVLFHRLLAWLSVKSNMVGYWVKGERISLYKNGIFNEKNMEETMISKKDLLEGVRLQTNTNSLIEVEEIFLERNGETSVVKK